jgi:ribosomal protein L11 methyltransferase
MRPGDAVLDVGTGSGILSAAASLLGAGRVVACDTDPDAVRIARDHFGIYIFTGSADAVLAGWADVIVANISSSVAEDLAPEFARVRRKPGTLIISGFEEWDLPEGFEPRETLRLDGWVCLVC